MTISQNSRQDGISDESRINQDAIRDENLYGPEATEEGTQGRFSDSESRRHIQTLVEEHGGKPKGYQVNSFKYDPDALLRQDFQEAIDICRMLGLKLFPYRYVGKHTGYLGMVTEEGHVYQSRYQCLCRCPT